MNPKILNDVAPFSPDENDQKILEVSRMLGDL